MVQGWQEVIRQIHASPHQAVLAVAGGGNAAICDLLAVPGGSRTLLEAVVPYSSASLAQWLGRSPDQFCSPETALAMATVAWHRARDLNRHPEATQVDEQWLIGLSCTASIVSDRPKRGEHRCYVASQTDTATRLYRLLLHKGARDRPGEDHLVGRLILQALAETCGILDVPDLDLLASERVLLEEERADPLLADVWCGRLPFVWSLPDGNLRQELPEKPAGLLSGSFNPLHEGHLHLRHAAEQVLGGLVAFELPVVNADKPPLDYLTTAQRRKQFTTFPLALTGAPTFVQKSEIFPGMTFVVGIDTAERIVQARFYHSRDDLLQAALRRIQEQGCRFLVAGRKLRDQFRTLADISIPTEFQDLFRAIPETAFRMDISSTRLRQKSQ